MMPSEKQTTIGVCERRVSTIGAAVLSQRASGDDAPTIEGHGALFNVETVIGGYFREVIAPGAFKDSISTDDIRVAFNHDPNFILGRTSAKTATVEEDGKGLKYTAVPPDTQAGRDTVTSIRRGDITGSSFQFTVENDADEEWDFEQTKKGMLPLRTIKRARLFEVGPVAFPAYETTTVSARAKEQVEEARAIAAQPKTPAATPATRSADDIKQSIQRDLDLLFAMAASGPAPVAEAARAAEIADPVTPPAAPPAPAAPPDVRQAPRVELSDFRRHLASLEAECQ